MPKMALHYQKIEKDGEWEQSSARMHERCAHEWWLYWFTLCNGCNFLLFVPKCHQQNSSNTICRQPSHSLNHHLPWKLCSPAHSRSECLRTAKWLLQTIVITAMAWMLMRWVVLKPLHSCQLWMCAAVVVLVVVVSPPLTRPSGVQLNINHLQIVVWSSVKYIRASMCAHTNPMR